MITNKALALLTAIMLFIAGANPPLAKAQDPEQNRDRQGSEQAAWKAARAAGTVAALSNFLDAYPQTSLLSKQPGELAFVDREAGNAYVRYVSLYGEGSAVRRKGWDGEVSTVQISPKRIARLEEETKRGAGYLLTAEEESPFGGTRWKPLGFILNANAEAKAPVGKRIINKLPLPCDWASPLATEAGRKGTWVADDGFTLHIMLADGRLGAMSFIREGESPKAVPIAQLDRRIVDRVIGTMPCMEIEFSGPKDQRAPGLNTEAYKEKGIGSLTPMALDVGSDLDELKVEKCIFNEVDYWSLSRFPTSN